MNAAGVGVTAVVLAVGAFVAADLDVLLLLLELPHPDSASAITGTAKISLALLTGFVLSLGAEDTGSSASIEEQGVYPASWHDAKSTRSFPSRSRAPAASAVGVYDRDRRTGLVDQSDARPAASPTHYVRQYIVLFGVVYGLADQLRASRGRMSQAAKR
jgi:hypothetical protein